MDIFLIRCLEVETAIKLEKYITRTSIFCIIVSKFSYKKESSPIILFIINENLEIDLYYIILPFNLAISLRLESNEEPLLDSKEVI